MSKIKYTRIQYIQLPNSCFRAFLRPNEARSSPNETKLKRQLGMQSFGSPCRASLLDTQWKSTQTKRENQNIRRRPKNTYQKFAERRPGNLSMFRKQFQGSSLRNFRVYYY